jgi:DNA-binding transcriptional LysR family regulator
MLYTVDRSDSQLEPLSSREIAAFVAAVETGGIGAAAAELALTQSAVTKRIKRLEQRLATSLLDRRHDGVHVTAAGRTFYPDAKEALAALTRADAVMRCARSRQPDRITLAASHTIGTYLLPGWLAAFRLQAPTVLPQLTILNTAAVVAAVREREAEIGLAPTEARLEGLEVCSVAHDELVVVVAAHHRWAACETISVAQLADERFFTLDPGSQTRASALRVAAHLGVELHPRLEVSSIEALKQAVRKDGFTILSALAVADERAAGQLHAIHIEHAPLRRELFAIRSRDRQPGEAAARFWRWLSGGAPALAAT